MSFNGLGMSMGTLSLLSNAKSRSISPENFDGAKGKGGMATEGISTGAARELGQGWKMSPAISIAPGECQELANIDGPGAIQQIWMTPGGHWRFNILRIYWDDQEQPSVECPVGDFFASGWQRFAQVSSLAALGRAIPAAAGRHSVGRVLVSDASDRAVPAAAGQRRVGNHLVAGRRSTVAGRDLEGTNSRLGSVGFPRESAAY